jgi:hypothetical protein
LSRSKLKARLIEPHNAQVIALSVLIVPRPSKVGFFYVPSILGVVNPLTQSLKVLH